MSTALTVVEGGSEELQTAASAQPAQRSVFEPRSLQEGIELAKWLFESGMLKKSIRSAQAAFALMVAGKEMGLSAMQSLRWLNMIDGNIGQDASSIVGMVLARKDVCEYFTLVESSAEKCTYKTKRVGGDEVAMSYTIKQAERAGLTGKDNWKKHTEAMLRARCSGALARAVYPDIAAGIYVPDEMEEIAAENGKREEKPNNAKPIGRAAAKAAAIQPAANDAAPAADAEPQPVGPFAHLDDTTKTVEEQVAIWSAAFDAVNTAAEFDALFTHWKSQLRAEDLKLGASAAYERAKQRKNSKGGAK